VRRFELAAFAALWTLGVACGDDGSTSDTVEDMTVPDERDAAMAEDLGTVEEDGGMDPTDMYVPDPDAGPVTCDEEGATRAVACGACGLRQETCQDGEWTATGDCLGEGECSPAAVDEEDTPMCGSRARICSDACTWSGWTMTSDDGECVAGAERSTSDGCPPDQSKEQTCSATCEWVDDTVCEGECGPLRTTPAHQEEVCVPAGTFIRGDDFFADAPETTVSMSAYVIDRYPVTNRRFRACRAAGACLGDLALAYWEDRLVDDTYLDHAVHMATYDQAVAFCNWDGGRRLVTEAEYEMAARGPAPRDNIYVWGDTYSCGTWPLPDCTDPVLPLAPVGTYPQLAGYYVDEITAGRTGAWVSDWFWDDYFTHPASLTDPTGPTSGTYRVRKSGGDNSANIRIGNRSGAPSAMGGWTFRCSRTP
jgi:formylglycine-generating enzyme required for sulfatase activity